MNDLEINEKSKFDLNMLTKEDLVQFQNKLITAFKEKKCDLLISSISKKNGKFLLEGMVERGKLKKNVDFVFSIYDVKYSDFSLCVDGYIISDGVLDLAQECWRKFLVLKFCKTNNDYLLELVSYLVKKRDAYQEMINNKFNKEWEDLENTLF